MSDSVIPDPFRLTVKPKMGQIRTGELTPESFDAMMNDGAWSFRSLGKKEAREFMEGAAARYEPFSEIEGIWHPVYQLACVRINHDRALYKVEVKWVDPDKGGGQVESG